MADTPDRDPRILDLMISQAEKRQRAANMGDFAEMELDELAACRKLCADVFGDKGLLECGPEEKGVIYMGFYIDPQSVPSHRRRRRLLFRGMKHAEFVEQIRLWKARQQ